MPKITISKSENHLPDKLHWELIFTTSNEDGTDVTINAEDIAGFVSEFGDLSWSFDIENLLMTPGKVQLTINDISQTIKHYLFEDNTVTGLPELRIYINDKLKFSSYMVADDMQYNFDNHTFKAGFISDLDIINKIKVYDNDTALNPLGLNNGLDYVNKPRDYGWYSVTWLITEIYKKVSPNINVIFNSTWQFWGWDNAMPPIGDIKFEELYVNSGPLFFDNTKSITSLGDVLKELASDFGCFTGLLNKDTAFFCQLYPYIGAQSGFNNSDNIQTLGRVLHHGRNYKHKVIDFVRVKTTLEKPYTSGVNTGTSDAVIDLTPMFCFYSALMDSGSLNYLKYTDIKAKLNRPFESVFSSSIAVNPGTTYTINSKTYYVKECWEFEGLYWVHVDGGVIALPPSGTLILYAGSGPASVPYTFSVNLDELYLRSVYKVIDKLITPIYMDSGQLLADFWLYHRHNPVKGAIEEITAEGNDYDFLKYFIMDNYKYQIISMTPHIPGKTDFEAIRIGEA